MRDGSSDGVINFVTVSREVEASKVHAGLAKFHFVFVEGYVAVLTTLKKLLNMVSMLFFVTIVYDDFIDDSTKPGESYEGLCHSSVIVLQY